MFAMFEKSGFPIGIDIGEHSVRLLQFKRAPAVGAGSENALALQAACRVEFSGIDAAAPDRCAAAIKQALAMQPFAGKRVVLSLPASAVHAKSVRLPQMPDADLTQALQWEANDRFGFEVNDNQGQLVWFRVGEVRRGTEVKDELLLFAVNGESLNRHMHAATTLGLQVTAVDLAACAAYRAARRISPALGKGTGAILDLGHAGSQFMITHDGELVFYKNIDIGGNRVDEAVAAKLGITPAEAGQMRARLALDATAAQDAAPLNQALRDAMRGPLEELAKELDMCMRYYVVTFRGARPEAIGLTGRQAGCPMTCDILAAALGLQMEETQVLRGVQGLGTAARPDRSGEWAVAAGLGLYTEDAGRRTEAA